MGKYSIRMLPIAEQDLDAAVDYLMTDSPDAALAFLDGMEQLERQLSNYPESGARVKDELYARLEYRFMLNCGFYVFYTLRENAIWIARIIHTRRDYCGLL